MNTYHTFPHLRLVEFEVTFLFPGTLDAGFGYGWGTAKRGLEEEHQVTTAVFQDLSIP